MARKLAIFTAKGVPDFRDQAEKNPLKDVAIGPRKWKTTYRSNFPENFTVQIALIYDHFFPMEEHFEHRTACAGYNGQKRSSNKATESYWPPYTGGLASVLVRVSCWRAVCFRLCNTHRSHTSKLVSLWVHAVHQCHACYTGGRKLFVRGALFFSGELANVTVWVGRAGGLRWMNLLCNMN